MLSPFYLNFVNIYSFLRKRDRDRVRVGEGQRERERETQSEAGSRSEPDAGLELTNGSQPEPKLDA